MRVVLALSASLFISFSVQDILAQGMYSGSGPDLFFAEADGPSPQGSRNLTEENRFRNSERDTNVTLGEIEETWSTPNGIVDGTSSLAINFNDFKSSTVQCLIESGVIPEGISGAIEDRPLTAQARDESVQYFFDHSREDEIEGNMGGHVPESNGFGYSMSWRFPKGSEAYNEQLRKVSDCYDPLVAEGSSPSSRPTVIPASAPALQSDSTAIDI